MNYTGLNVLLLLLVACGIATCTELSTIEQFRIPLGDSIINVTKEQFLSPTGCKASYCTTLGFLNLHENENTSVVAVRNYLYYHGGTLVKFEKGPTRTVNFAYEGDKLSLDPNRMFTWNGINATLQKYNSGYPVTDALINIVQQFATTLLDIYDFKSQTVVLALHNNGGTYGADDYLPGGTYENDAESVTIAAGTNPSDFYYVVDPNYYEYLGESGYNVVLQSNSTVTDDGSLSYYCGVAGKPYVNFEAEAETGAIGAQVVRQLDMIEAVGAMLIAK